MADHFVTSTLIPVQYVSLMMSSQSLHPPAAELHAVLQPYLLRRVKTEVALELPQKTELLVYHGLSALQKRYYKAILMKDLGEQTGSAVAQI